MRNLYEQGGYRIRMGWGEPGARAARADVAVIVDVFSFSTSVCIAVERGMEVFPFRWGGVEAQEFARENGAQLARGRLEASKSNEPTSLSLSPANLLTREPVARLVLPSPNGSTIVEALRPTRVQILLGCLRNSRAVATFLNGPLQKGMAVSLIAAGERWEDGSLRPALEDQLGVGSILAHLEDDGHGDSMSPEARLSSAAYRAVQEDTNSLLRHCVGGRELESLGFSEDVSVACQLDVSACVPRLIHGRFVAA